MMNLRMIYELFAIALLFQGSVAQESGPRKITGRIVGGSNVAHISSMPFIVRLGYDVNQNSFATNCGGSIISATRVLTAAHCSYSTDQNGNSFKIPDTKRFVLAGSTQNNDLKYKYQVSQVVDHPGYNNAQNSVTATAANDISVLKLAKSIPLTGNAPFARAIPLASYARVTLVKLENVVNWSSQYNAYIRTPKATYNALPAWVAGWGLTTYTAGGKSSSVLKKADLELYDKATCAAASSWGVVPDKTICGGHLGRNSDTTCKGDSGGPFVQGNELVGVVSFGLEQCGSGQYPTVFTDVFAYKAWINRI